MKKLTLLAIAIVMLAGMASAQTPNAKQGSTEMAFASTPVANAFSWDKSKFDFGKIPQGKPVNVVFNFTNKGDKPIIVTNVSTPCGCTAADFSKESIAPGKKGFVKLTYNAAANGTFTKTVTVYTNTQPETIPLTINGEVISTTAE
jgi:hypothetical protein